MSRTPPHDEPSAHPGAAPDPKRPAYDNPKTGPLRKDRTLPANLDGPLGPKTASGGPAKRQRKR